MKDKRSINHHTYNQPQLIHPISCTKWFQESQNVVNFSFKWTIGHKQEAQAKQLVKWMSVKLLNQTAKVSTQCMWQTWKTDLFQTERKGDRGWWRAEKLLTSRSAIEHLLTLRNRLLEIPLSPPAVSKIRPNKTDPQERKRNENIQRFTTTSGRGRGVLTVILITWHSLPKTFHKATLSIWAWKRAKTVRLPKRSPKREYLLYEYIYISN